LGIALQLFTSESSTYPLLINPGYSKGAGAYPEHYLGWMDAIQHQLSKLGVRWDSMGAERAPYPPEGIWHCPAAYFPSSFEPDQDYSDYGYNCYGISRPDDTNSLGLGGHYVWRGTRLPAPPVKESEVAKPSEMLAIGDGFWGSGNVIKDGTPWLRRYRTEDYRGSTKRAYARHLEKANILFCDEHVEACGLKVLFEDSSDMALSRWNLDHQPHPERLSP
jgi:prepilin-type processing-associated H-X9-DG protein